MANNGNRALDCPVVSRANTMEVMKARDDPANMADMPTNAASGRVTPEEGNMVRMALPSNAPMAPPMVSNGASVPPDVPLPKEIDHDTNFSMHSDSKI